MMVRDAVATARTEHVIFFLVAAYVETLSYYGETRSVLHPDVVRLPLSGTADLAARLRRVRDMLGSDEAIPAQVSLVMEEARDIFTAAVRRLSALAPPAGMSHRTGRGTHYGYEMPWGDRRWNDGQRDCPGDGRERL